MEQLFQIEHLEELAGRGGCKMLAGEQDCQTDGAASSSSKDELDQMDRIKDYYESELGRRDEIIAQQRAVIRQLTEK